MGVEIPAGGEESPKQETAPDTDVVAVAKPDNISEQPSSNLGRNLFIGLLFSGILLAVVLSLVPDWDSKTELASIPKGNSTEKPFANGFQPILPVFDEKVTEGYDNITDLENDLQQFGFMTLNQAMSGFGGGGGWGCWGGYYPMPFFEDGDVALDAGRPVAAPVPGGGAADSGAGEKNIFEGVDDFGTNNQEDSIDTADLTKSDGTFIYASYRETLVVWSVADGKIMSKIQMPKINIERTDNEEILGGPYGHYYNWVPTPRIEAILLEGDNLALVVSGYGAEHQSKLSEQAPICDYLATRIMVYDINGGSPELLRQQDIHGHFKQAYSTNGAGHVVTAASIDTWTHLREPIQRWKFEGLTDEEYEAEAIRIAQENVPKFASNLATLLSKVDLARLSLFVSNVEDEETLDGIMSQLKVADSITMVGSFNFNDDTASTELDVSLAGTTQPGNWGYVYANGDMILVADRGYEWVKETEQYAEMTFLVGFRLDGASAKHEVVGSVFGAPLNSYSLDMVEKDGALTVRIATTINFWRGFVFSDEGGAADSMIGSTVSDPLPPTDDTSRTWNEIAVLGTTGPTGTLLEKKSSVRLGKPNERFTAVRFLDDIAYAVTFERIDPLYTVDLSNPDDIKILGELEVTGFSEYLHPIEGGKILAVGQETDEEGAIIGLQISLFSASNPAELSLINRLQLLNEENGSTSSGASWEPRAFRYFTVDDLGILIIPVTKYNWNSWWEWDEDEMLVDEEEFPAPAPAPVSEPKNLTLEELPEPVPAPDGDRLQQPQDNFEGFEVFTVQNDVISRFFTIDHADFNKLGNESCRNWCGDLPERSFVVDGDLITMKGQSVISTDLNTQKSDWFISMRQAICCSV